MEWALIPQSVAALATTAAAVAAWKSALASKRTSQEALRALGVGIRPKMQVEVLRGGGEPAMDSVVVTNVSEWDALDVEVKVQLRNGATTRERSPRLMPLILRDGRMTGDRMDVDFGAAGEEGSAEDRLRAVIVRFWDGRRICRYEQRNLYFPEGVGFDRVEEQIEGPR